MLNKEFLNLSNLKSINEVFKRLNCLRRWTSITSDSRYNELAKQALNCNIAFMLASYVEEQKYATIKWQRFPKIALYRAFQKSYVNYDTKEHTLKEICAIGNIPESAFEIATMDIITEETNGDFSYFISEGIGTIEMDIYRAATKIATLVELQEHASSINGFDAYRHKFVEMQKSIEQFESIPCVLEFSNMDGKYFQLFSEISQLRNQNRWAVQPYLVNCSVLGHLFDTALFAYLIGLEQFNGDESIASKMFFIGIFHDIAERWTNDIPSPIKNKIKGFRDAIEKYENKVLAENLYGQVSPSIGNSVRSVMMEEKCNISYYKLMKAADYLSADSECWRQYIAGSREPYYYKSAIMGFEKNLIAEQYILPPICKTLHDYYRQYSENVVKQFEI